MEESAEFAAQGGLEKERAVVEREASDRAHEEALRRAAAAEEAARRTAADKNATEVARQRGELELAAQGLQILRERAEAELEILAHRRRLADAAADRDKSAAEQALALDELRSRAKAAIEEREIAAFRARRQVENELSDGLLKSQLVSALPEIAGKLPAPAELKSITLSGDGGGAAALAGLVSSLMAFLDRERKEPRPSPERESAAARPRR